MFEILFTLTAKLIIRYVFMEVSITILAFGCSPLDFDTMLHLFFY